MHHLQDPYETCPTYRSELWSMITLNWKGTMDILPEKNEPIKNQDSAVTGGHLEK